MVRCQSEDRGLQSRTEIHRPDTAFVNEIQEKQETCCTADTLGIAGPFQMMVPKAEGLPAEKALDSRHHLIQVSFRQRSGDAHSARQVGELRIEADRAKQDWNFWRKLPISRAASIPFLRGFKKSRTTTSGVSSRALQTASSPSMASPRTSHPQWLHRSRSRQCRTTGLSSAIKIRVTTWPPKP